MYVWFFFFISYLYIVCKLLFSSPVFACCEGCKSTSEDDAMYYEWVFPQLCSFMIHNFSGTVKRNLLVSCSQPALALFFLYNKKDKEIKIDFFQWNIIADRALFQFKVYLLPIQCKSSDVLLFCHFYRGSMRRLFVWTWIFQRGSFLILLPLLCREK